MGKMYALLVLMAIAMNVSAQLNESFTDGNFTVDPVWNGNAASWQVVTDSDVGSGAVGSSTLRLNAPGTGVAWISTQVLGSWKQFQSWGFFVGRRSQSFTNANYIFIWLWCSESDLTSVTADGYRIRIGDDGGGDEIILQRVTDGVATDIMVGPALANGLIDIGFLLRVTRSAAGVWQLFTSPLPTVNGSGAVATDVPNAVNANILQASVADNTHVSFDNGWLGFVAVFSAAASARAAQEFDQVMVSFGSAALPVKLEQFQAIDSDNVVRLWWTVSQEWNVDRYEVQRSIDGVHYKVIGSIEAGERNFYSFNDDVPLTGKAFYRLRIIDVDGTEEISRVVLIKREQVQLKVWPNPVRSILNVEHPPGCLKIINSSGVVVRRMNFREAGITRIDVALLSPGVYYISVGGSSSLPVFHPCKFLLLPLSGK